MKKKSECLGIYHYRWQKIGKMMKLCIILVCLFSFSLSATTLAQRERVSMKLQEVSLRQVLEQIREQTNLQFMMSKEQGERVGRVSVNAENATVAEVLDKVFASTGLTWVINEDIIVVKERPQSSVLSPAPDCVKGVVKDEKGNPLPGVTVRVKGTILGTSTDADGRFSLLLIDEKEMAFVFSFVGMQSQEVAYTGQKELNIVMQAEVAISRPNSLAIRTTLATNSPLDFANTPFSRYRLSSNPTLTFPPIAIAGAAKVKAWRPIPVAVQVEPAGIAFTSQQRLGTVAGVHPGTPSTKLNCMGAPGT